MSISIFPLDIADLVTSSMTAVQDDQTGQKLWQCNQCFYTKRFKSHVVKHIERMHVKVSMSCQYCDLVDYLLNPYSLGLFWFTKI